MHLLIIGASGLIGSELLHRSLEEEGISKITIIVRKKIDIQSNKLHQIIFPKFGFETIKEIVFDTPVDISFCGLGTTIKKAGSKEAFRKVDYDYVLGFAKLVELQQIPALFVVTAMGAKENSRIFYSKIKGEVERDISKLSIPSIYFLNPSLLIGTRTDKRFGEELGTLVYKSIGVLLPNKIRNFMGTEVKDIINFLVLEFESKKPGVHRIQDWILK
jgi:uncharacterized protein YbjT (DUF2867 family)